MPRGVFPILVRAGDIVVANDAATLPASLSGVHLPTGAAVELRLAGRDSLSPACVRRFMAVVFGAGDFRTPTEHRPPPPSCRPGDGLQLGPLARDVVRVLAHPRSGRGATSRLGRGIWAGWRAMGGLFSMRISQHRWRSGTHGRESPASRSRSSRRQRASSSTGPDPVAPVTRCAVRHPDPRGRDFLNRRRRSRSTAAVRRAVSHSGIDRHADRDAPARGRVIAIGTTVVRALEHAARRDGTVRPGAGLATERVGPHTRLARRRCHRLRTARTRHQPLRVAARVPGRRGAWPDGRPRRKRTATGRTSSATRCFSCAGRPLISGHSPSRQAM